MDFDWASWKVERLQQAEAAAVQQAEQLRKLKEEVGHVIFVSTQRSNGGMSGLNIRSFQ